MAAPPMHGGTADTFQPSDIFKIYGKGLIEGLPRAGAKARSHLGYTTCSRAQPIVVTLYAPQGVGRSLDQSPATACLPRLPRARQAGSKFGGWLYEAPVSP
mgnify:FL=1